MEKLFRNELDALLNESRGAIANRASQSFETWEKKIRSNGIFLFGSGGFGKRTLKGLREIGIEPIGFCDNNQALWNQQVEGIKVFSPEEATQKYPQAVFMVTIWSDAIGHPVEEVKTKLHSYRIVDVISFFFLY
jgi:FlaA1/EpsC-like NDP-sugar epimerase